MAHLNDRDRIASTHRGHGHCIAKGVDVHAMMAEIHGKSTGACRGKGGSMHIADLSKGMMGANGILAPARRSSVAPPWRPNAGVTAAWASRFLATAPQTRGPFLKA